MEGRGKGEGEGMWSVSLNNSQQKRGSSRSVSDIYTSLNCGRMFVLFQYQHSGKVRGTWEMLCWCPYYPCPFGTRF